LNLLSQQPRGGNFTKIREKFSKFSPKLLDLVVKTAQTVGEIREKSDRLLPNCENT
jgi:hypothetical protein